MRGRLIDANVHNYVHKLLSKLQKFFWKRVVGYCIFDSEAMQNMIK